MECLENGCNTLAYFNYKDKKCGIYCSIHKKIDMINVVSFFHYEYSQNWDIL